MKMNEIGGFVFVLSVFFITFTNAQFTFYDSARTTGTTTTATTTTAPTSTTTTMTQSTTPMATAATKSPEAQTFAPTSTSTILTTRLMSPPTTPGPIPTCQCVTTGFCEITGGQSSVDGSGKIDMRMANVNTPVNASGTAIPITSPASTGITQITTPPKTCNLLTERCCTDAGYKCGLRYPPVFGSPKINNNIQTVFGSYPWQGIVFRKDLNITSGALIDQKHFLTTAINVQAFVKSASSLSVRLGEWDLRNTTTEPLPYQEYTVESIIVHPAYDKPSSKNNIAILTLKKQVTLGEFPTIGTACLPSSPITGIRCWASGWSYAAGNLTKQDIQRQVDLPLVDAATCQTQLRNTILGPKFVLDNSSFICAGGEQGKDICDGDPAAPLVCEVASQFYLTGLNAWGMDCAKKNIPGVYVNVQTYVPWIQATITPAPSQGSTLKVSISTTASPPPATFMNSTTSNLTTTKAEITTLKAAVQTTTIPPTTLKAAVQTTTIPPTTLKAALQTTNVSQTTTTSSTLKTTVATTTKVTIKP